MLKTQTISRFCLNAAEGKLTFVLNIIIINIIILAPASTLSAGYWIEQMKFMVLLVEIVNLW